MQERKDLHLESILTRNTGTGIHLGECPLVQHYRCSHGGLVLTHMSHGGLVLTHRSCLQGQAAGAGGTGTLHRGPADRGSGLSS